jgi:hypothetical protein
VAAGFILLAVLPPGQAAAPQWASISTRKGAIVATTGVLVVAAVLAQAVRPDAQAFARAHAGYGRLTRGQAAVLLDPTATVPDDVTFGFPFANRTAGELRAVLDAYGADGGPGETDRLLVVIGAVDLVRGPPGTAPEGCHDLRRPIRTAPDSRIGLYARTGAGTPEVLVRRFGPEWVTVGHLEEGQRATLLLPGYAAGAEWQVNVGEGICVVPARP